MSSPGEDPLGNRKSDEDFFFQRGNGASCNSDGGQINPTSRIKQPATWKLTSWACQ